MLEQLSPEQRQKLVMEMRRVPDDPRLESLLLSGSVMTAAKMSGFGVYLLASTILGGLTNALGITLPFAIYMGMSQTIALILGPVGWAALAGGLLFTLNQPNWNRLTLAVVYVSTLRHSSEMLSENLRQARIEKVTQERIEFWRSRGVDVK